MAVIGTIQLSGSGLSGGSGGSRGGSGCVCNIAAQFATGAQGIISANLRANTNITVTEGGIVLEGPTMGDLAISAYTVAGEDENCPGRAGTSFEWTQKISCDSGLDVYFIPNGRAKAYMEGGVAREISMIEAGCSYQTFSASAQSGPTTPVLTYNHSDGYDMRYTSGPIPVSPSNGKQATSIGFLNNYLPTGSRLYMTSFSW